MLHQTGSGALGPVYRAYDPDQGRLVAVKVFALNLEPAQAHALVARLQDLVGLDLTHPGVAAPVAAGLADGLPYLAQDFAAADSLDAVIREFGATSPPDAARVVTQVAGALDAAAAQGVYHGSLHPRDLLLTADDSRVAGFGVAQALEVIGLASPARAPYAAPERVNGAAWDRRADIYSLALLATEILTGRAPAGPAALDALLGGSKAELHAFGQVLRKAMAERPEDRYDTAAAFAEALKSVADLLRTPDAVSTPAPTPPPVEARLPLDEPVRGVAETLLPGDVPASSDSATLDGPLIAFSAEDDSELTLATPPSRRDRPNPDWKIPANRLTAADIDVDVELDRALKADTSVEATVVTREERSLETHRADGSDRRVATADRRERGRHRASLGTALTAGTAGGATAVGQLSDVPLGPQSAPAAMAPAGLTPATSSVWPIPLAWMVGLIMGIAVGFFIFSSRDSGEDVLARTPAAETTTATSAPPAPTVASQPAQPPSPSVASPVAAATATTGAAPAPTLAPDRVESPASTANAAESRRGAESTGTSKRADRAPARSSATATAASPSAPRRSGRLLVRSSPAGARVQLDGKDVGATPLTLRALAFGSHTVRVTRTGYGPEERRVTVSASQPAQSIVVDLTPPRGRPTPEGGAEVVGARPATTGGAGVLIVDSRPSGAAIYIDGRRVGTTPATIDNVRVGQHTLFLELEGFRGWSRLVELAAGENRRVSAALEQ